MRNGHICILFQSSLILLHTLVYTDGACTFPAAIRGDWVSSEKGTLNFTEDTLWNYPIQPITASITSLSFTCNEKSGNKYFLQSTTTFTLFGFQFRAYLCLEFDKISDYKFTYQVANDVDATTSERFYVAVNLVNPDIATGCNRAEPYETATFNVLLKEGAITSGLAESTCPYDILHKYSNGSLKSADGSKTCVNTSLNVCEDRTRMIQTYDPSCDSSLKFASEGTYICLQEMANETSGVTYLHVWNNDTTLATGIRRINCYAFEVIDQTMVATLYPGACLISQTPTVVTAPGIVVEYNTITKTCQSIVESGPQTVYIVAIVFGFLAAILIIIVTVCVIIETKCRCITKLCRKKSKIGHSEISLGSSSENGLEAYLRTVRRDQPPGVFVARKPIKLGPIIEPYLEPPAKVELLYDVEPRPSSSRLMFRSSLFLSQLSLKNI